MHCKAIIFDLDGTLLDSLTDIAEAANRMLQQKGYPPHPIKDYQHFIGDGARTLVQRILPQNERTANEISRCLEIFMDDYSRHWNVQTQLYAEIPEVLNKLNDLGIQLNILSNKPHLFTTKCVAEYLSEWSFKRVGGQKEGGPKKPDPAGALRISKELGISPDHFLFLGDSGVDMQTARAAGMTPIGVLWGYRSSAELKNKGAEILIDHPLELFAIDLGLT